ncbi:hypothetical protein GOP47_0011572 [Adiantum capillus-veneris]|uniref:CAAX amino terminal protease n=1 Tax=Adiantum capillus-veneris TaxID=13818 RepID=A0A9D4UTG1_ADICA|nr:hypothetical protein GOP47_0011572 [Adiantum capillus-veneris]
MQNSRSLNSPWSPCHSGKRCLFSSPRASFIFDPSGGYLSEVGQSIIRCFQIDTAEAAKLLPESASDQSHSESLLHHLNAITIEVFSVALLLGTSIGYLISRIGQKEAPGSCEPASEWLLIMNATPFNRFLLMRCPSIKFKDMDVYDGLSKKLTAEGHHVVKIRNASLGISDQDAIGDCNSPSLKKEAEWTGRFLQSAFHHDNLSQGQAPKESNIEEHMPTYQRIFLHTKDGGVLAIDWPSHLELSGEHGLDTTVLLVPGLSNGSKEKGIQEFVQRCVKHGYFPIVLNPRGCGGSPLTTPRLFTAGDSDDVRMAVEFVLKSRPWATVMAVGWGYGADMLVKYFGEEAASTPVTAAVCIENTFDLEEATKFSQDDRVELFNQKMASSFVEILKSNQMVFEGKGRYFDVQKGLSAKTVRDFDEAISIVARGYNNIQEFYRDSSFKSWIAKVKIPIFCIQDNTSIGKTLSIPRHVFEENPFTTLILLLTRRGEPITQTNASIHSSLVIEWLAAVELAFLKGRHPLLQGIDVSFKLLKERWFNGASQSSQDSDVMARTANQSTSLERTNESSVNYLPSVNQRPGYPSRWYRGHSTDVNEALKDSKALIQTSEDGHGFDNENLDSGEFSGSKEEPHDSDTDASDGEDSEMEQGQVRQAAESVLKVLDVTMPGTLSEKQKEEVLEAVGRGETIVSALQEACPEDVREKMVTAVSAAVQARGISMKLAGFGKKMPAPKIPAGMVENIERKLSSLVQDKSPITPVHDTAKITSEPVASGSNASVGSGDQGNTSSQSDEAQNLSQEGLNNRQPESCTSVLPGGQTENGAATDSSSKADSDVDQRVNQAPIPEKQRQDDVSPVTDKETNEMEADPNKTSESNLVQAEKQGDTSPQEQQKSHGLEQKQESSVAALQMNEPQLEKKNDTATNSNLNEHNKTILEQTEASPPQTPPIPPASPLPSVDISRAFEALTGVDDSTQMAVTNVFGVIENVLEQLEKEQGQKDEPLQQGQKDEQVEKTVHESPMDGRDMDTQKQIFMKEPHGDMAGQLGLPEGMPSQQCPGKGSDKLKEELRNLQKGTSRDFDTKTDGKCFSNLSSGSHKSSSLELDDSNLALEYFEDENIWKLIDGSSDSESINNGMTEGTMDEHTKFKNSKLDVGTFTEENQEINPEYIILDDAVNHIQDNGIFSNRTVEFNDKNLESSYQDLNSAVRPPRNLNEISPVQRKIQELVTDALELELLRRLGNSEMRLLDNTLECDLEVVSLTVAKTAGIGLKAHHLDSADEEAMQDLLNVTNDVEDKVHADTIISAINRLYGELTVLPSVLPAGVVLGIVLAALNPLGVIDTDHVNNRKTLVQTQQEGSSSRKSLSLVQANQNPKFLEKKIGRDGITSTRQLLTKPQEKLKTNETSDKEDAIDRDSCSKDAKLLTGAETSDRKLVSAEKANSTSNMMGTMAAAVSATAALVGEEKFYNTQGRNEGGGSQVFTNDTVRNSSESTDEQLDQDENKPSMVSTLAEKAMSVAAPMVPTKQDGGVDHERLVEILAGMGQKGGILRFVGKMALLWGGLRGAMSLTDRLLGFLHVSDRPLYQRITGFMVMVLLLWSPVLVPLLPTLLQQWASRSQNGIASTAALIGLYCAVVILISIWGRKIRGYKDPLHQYGVNLQPQSYARQLLAVLSGLVVGLSLVASVYLLGVALQLIQFDWTSTLLLNTSKNHLWTIVCGLRIFKLMIQCFGISLVVSFVEELFFRSWLQKEISADLGFHKAALISGLAFSITHRSLPLMPGLWLLSYILTGAKVRCSGNLNVAIGIHAGLMAGTQLVSMYGQVKYGANASLWFIGHQNADPFTGLIGLSILGVLALLLYPWGYNEKERN